MLKGTVDLNFPFWLAPNFQDQTRQRKYAGCQSQQSMGKATVHCSTER